MRGLEEVKRYLAEALGEDLRYVEFFKEKNKPVVIVKPLNYIPNATWKMVQRLVKKVGGRWRRFDRFWEVPLEEEVKAE